MAGVNIESWIGKQVVLFFEDGEKVSRKNGTLKGTDDAFIILESIDGNTHAIPINRLIRVEPVGK